MANDKVMVIVTNDNPPHKFKTAHHINSGESVEIYPPAEGAAIWFSVVPQSVTPPVTPTYGVYSLPLPPTTDHYKFVFDSTLAAGVTDVTYQVGPPGSTPGSGMNPSAHTVRVGAVGPIR